MTSGNIDITGSTVTITVSRHLLLNTTSGSVTLSGSTINLNGSVVIPTIENLGSYTGSILFQQQGTNKLVGISIDELKTLLNS